MKHIFGVSLWLDFFLCVVKRLPAEYIDTVGTQSNGNDPVKWNGFLL